MDDTARRKQWDGCEDDDAGGIPLIEANRDSVNVIAPRFHWLQQSKVDKVKDANKARVKYVVEFVFRASQYMQQPAKSRISA